MAKTNFDATFDYKLIYVFRINDSIHKDCLKIGDATIHTNKNYNDIFPSSSELNYAAKKRIDEYTATAGISYDLLYTEIAVYSKNNKLYAFRDHNVHDVLKRSGIRNKYFDTNKTQNEWFVCDLNTAKNAIKAVKEGKNSLNNSQITQNQTPIIFRPEQKEAINLTKKRFKANQPRVLWNAKMRFGKTLSALEVVKQMGFKKTIIVTHRPVVNEGWYEDFNKIFFDRNDYEYGSKTTGHTFNELINSNSNFVYFASLQDLRGSDAVGGTYDKNDEIFSIVWDLVIVDEAHEGTTTKLGQAVTSALIKGNEHHTKLLELSGTPFNILDNYESDNIYTWDYIMEQKAKEDWKMYHFGDPNPYDELPKMNIFTYHLEKTLPAYLDVVDNAFNFKEFFKVWTGNLEKDGRRIPDQNMIGDFIHENDIKSFLDLICKKDNENNYPFSNETYRNYFRHTLWIIPGVKEAKALSKLLKMHPVFCNFDIVNVAGDGDEEISSKNALEKLNNAITDHPENTRTITLSCGRLTTGVTVKPWTAILYLAGSYSTDAKQYLQTIFRVQSPANINGKVKENCFVFDFAPDRTLKMVAESVSVSYKAGANDSIHEIRLKDFLNFCPVIAIDGSNMKVFKVAELLQQLKKVYIERVQRNGFDDPHIYNDKLLKLTDLELKKFEKLNAVVGKSKQTEKTQNITINNEGFSNEEIKEINTIESKPKKERTPEEEARLEELKKAKKNRLSAISNLRAISIRMPLLVYGMNIDIKTDITIDNFTDYVDESSWNEFMPKDVTKEMFKEFIEYYDKDIFIGAARRIRYIAKSADELEPTERVKEIAGLFSTFKNPDKETVLTPWRVVNMHMSNTIGGYDFFDEQHENTLTEPRFVEQKDVTTEVFDKDAKILEINSKTGLYPLYVTYSLYRNIIKDIPEKELTFEQKLQVWDNVIKNNIFVICKTTMARAITKRTLLGYRGGTMHSHAFDDLIMQMKDKQQQLINKIKNPSFWNIKEAGEMKFNAVVGNPPYQIMDGGAKASAQPIYNYFVEFSKTLKPEFFTLIMPSRWMIGGKGLDKFRSNMIHDTHIKKLFDHLNSTDCFSNVEIKGGVCYFLWQLNYNDKCEIHTFTVKGEVKSSRFLSTGEDDIYIRAEILVEIKDKVSKLNEEKFSTIVSARKPYGLEAETMVNASKYGLPNFNTAYIKSYFKVFGLGEKGKRQWKYIPKTYPLPKISPCFMKYKVFIAEAYGCGALGEVPSTPVLSTPGELCTETFLEIGPFNTEKEADNVIKYIKTKFFRLLVGIQKQTQHTTQKVYRFVPIQDFTPKSDIDWSKSIAEIDEQLFKKYNLNEEEINYIKTNVQEMK